MADPIDARTATLSDLKPGTLVTNVNGSPTIWRIVDNKGTLKKVREP